MPGCRIWDVVKVPFPYTNRPVEQRRPAIVVALPAASGTPELLWVLMVTSAVNRGWPGDVDISDLELAGLPVASVVRTAKIATVEAHHTEPLGQLSANDRSGVADILRDVLGAIVA